MLWRGVFHLAEDPREIRDRANEPAWRERLRRLADELAAWQRRVDDPPPARPVLPAG